jgi:hypothetical protein
MIDITAEKPRFPLDITKTGSEPMHPAAQIAILGHLSRRFQACAERLVEVPVDVPFEIPAREPCFPYAAIADHLVNKNTPARAVGIVRERHVSPRRAAVKQFLHLIGQHRDQEIVEAVARGRRACLFDRLEIAETIRVPEKTSERHRRELWQYRDAQPPDVDTPDV